MARRSGAATIAEVAKAAGVSPATVSRVMNDRFVGDPAVAERVRAVAADLSYSPSHFARSLALGQTKAIAFIVPDLANPAFQAVLSGLSKAAGRDGYRVLVADSSENPDEEPLLAREVRRRCDAIVLCAPRMSDEELSEIAGSLEPLVLINRTGSGDAVPSLAIDYRAGIRSLAEHLHSLGHRHLVYVEGPERSVSNRYRRDGLEEFERDTPGARVTRVAGGATTDDGIAAAPRVRETGATAALAFNDLVAIGLLNGLVDLGVEVPAEISVTGFDDIPFARFTTPPLTTASVPHPELGTQAWQRLLAVIRGEDPEPDLVLQPHVEIRSSTARPEHSA
ncbi:LacI family DNA-binding transcriptional regulator [Herbiconiux sp. SYSU D00978]|uniref:LacI family DNA-binding transcriptional regulator n=1 Tax=Herbiconiux sp. SYSU D00978 TaxID=2812562 RepID=UPI001A95D790|nr:LacI family DNA-binding transcriptional regulator [Herbiconiux sp. SYSU D00978]